jgi:hypothetical protein
MLFGMARQAIGVESGRFAYGLPCGGGKTQGVVALILAAREIEPALTFAVATSQIESLCQMKRQLIASGMSADQIALWHSLKVDSKRAGSGTGFASEPATDFDDARNVLLLSHEKVRRLRDGMVHRSLLVWDESLFSTEAQALSIETVHRAKNCASDAAPKLAFYLSKASQIIEAEAEALVADPSRLPQTIECIWTEGEIQAIRDALSSVKRSDKFARAVAETTESLLKLLVLPVSVVVNGDRAVSNGVIRYEITIDPALSNIAILDASHAIRILTKADRSIAEVKLPEYKRYSNVTVRQIDMAAGKSTVMCDESASKPVAHQVASIIDGLPEGESVIVFTFLDAKRQLQRNLAAQGVDTDRIKFATWGQETSRNEWAHCQHVIMAGVLRRNPLELSASLLGQQMDMGRRNSAKTLRDVTLSEMAHCVLQGMNRGTCRKTGANGEAHRMSLTIIVSKASELRSVLAECLPGVSWSAPESPTSKPSKVSVASRLIEHFLVSYEQPALSLMKLKKAFPDLSALNPRTFRRATEKALLECIHRGVRWEMKERSLIRSLA